MNWHNAEELERKL